jgi:hypothetical protein
MALRDYIACGNCGCKIVYDGNDNGRNRLEMYWGNPDAETWTVHLLCPDCLKAQTAEIERLRGLLRECLDRWIPFADLDMRSRVREALGDE